MEETQTENPTDTLDVQWKQQGVEHWEKVIADPIICYVLVRTDMPDFKWGRTCAQVHHCGTQMTEEKIAKSFPELNSLYRDWLADPELELAAAKAIVEESRAWAQADADRVAAFKAGEEFTADPSLDARIAKEEACDAAAAARRTFGTVLTLAVTAAEMRQAVSLAQLIGLHAGVTHDPTYPIFVRDGDRTQVVTAPVDSCAYIFGRKSECTPVLGQFDLLNESHII